MTNIEDFEQMTNFEEMEIVGERISTFKDRVKNFSSWKALKTDSEYDDVVKNLVKELKHSDLMVECRDLVADKEKKAKYEEVKRVVSLLEVRVKEIKALNPKVN